MHCEHSSGISYKWKICFDNKKIVTLSIKIRQLEITHCDLGNIMLDFWEFIKNGTTNTKLIIIS